MVSLSNHERWRRALQLPVAMHPLDDPGLYSLVDPADMLGRLRELPRQCREAWRRAQPFALSLDRRPVARVLVLGMGGSAIAGDMLAALVAGESPVPVLVLRGYDLPPGLNEDNLIIASSYSGETEETLSAFQQALATGAGKLAVTSGGRLEALARERSVPVFRIEHPGPPRAALGYSLMPLLAVARRFGLLSLDDADVEEAAAVMGWPQARAGRVEKAGLLREIDAATPAAENPAKALAERLLGRLPVVYGAGFLSPVARRWKTQLNENSKVWSSWEELPEADHNAVVGYRLPEEVRRQAFVVLLHSSHLHPRTLLRYEATRELLQEAEVEHETIEAHGRGPLAQMLSLALYGDYVSYYLALLQGVDPTPVPAIEALKKQLAQGT
ncbi:MAG TPA: bifunctional phosphoglucose/phosphomannose isomerase [Dehalococcoidia bacterium]|nr:bifunctional phosphoglucose/phosphomannose isomerase [Dehalococcoidia bacterium]